MEAEDLGQSAQWPEPLPGGVVRPRPQQRLVGPLQVGDVLGRAGVPAVVGRAIQPLAQQQQPRAPGLLAGSARTIATGDLDGRIPRVTARDEVGELAESLDFMKVSLKTYIQDLTEATAARERIESELQVAHDIQI